MEKRTKLLILIIIVAVLLGFGIWYLLSPLIRTVQQPPALQNGVTPSAAPAAKPIQTTTAPEVVSTSTRVAAASVKQLQDLAGVVVARLGSGSSGEGFRGYEDVMINATPSFQKELRTMQKTMQQAHPAGGPAFGIVTRVVSYDLQRAVANAPEVPIIVKVQHAEDAGDPTRPTRVTYRQVTVTFTRQADEAYLVSSLVWQDISL